MTQLLVLTEKVNMYWNSETIYKHILYSEAQTDRSMTVHLSLSFMNTKTQNVKYTSSVDNSVDYDNVLSFTAVKISSQKHLYKMVQHY